MRRVDQVLGWGAVVLFLGALNLPLVGIEVSQKVRMVATVPFWLVFIYFKWPQRREDAVCACEEGE